MIVTAPAIRVENLSKRYLIGARQNGYRTLREALVDLASAPLSRLRRLSGRAAEEEHIWALEGVSFDIQPGEVVGIIGRNGAGKSTLLKVLSKITEPTTGRAEIRGRLASLLEVGTGFHPELTGRENIFLNGAILGMTKAEIRRKFDEIVAFAEIDKFLDTPVKRYSSGMHVRLAFAVAAHLEPEILIVDEVLAVGDIAFQRKCLGKMENVAQEGRTVLFVSHNMAAIQALCSRGILFDRGAIADQGDVQEVVLRYLRSLEVDADSSLAGRARRAGAGKVRLTEIQVLSPDNRPIPLTTTGSPVRFAFHFNQNLNSFRLIFALYDEYANLVADFDSRLACDADRLQVDNGNIVTCDIGELTLVPGRYRMNVAIKTGGQLQDHVEGAMVLEVREGVLRGRPVPAGTRGVMSIPHRWSLHQAEI